MQLKHNKAIYLFISTISINSLLSRSLQYKHIFPDWKVKSYKITLFFLGIVPDAQYRSL